MERRQLTHFLVRDTSTNRVVAWRVRRADTWIDRTLGFLPRATIAPEEGMWFERCNAIHTLGMRSALDVVFLDREGRIVRTEEVRPQRLYVGEPGAHTVAEFGPGFLRANALGTGTKLTLEPIDF